MDRNKTVYVAALLFTLGFRHFFKPDIENLSKYGVIFIREPAFGST